MSYTRSFEKNYITYTNVMMDGEEFIVPANSFANHLRANTLVEKVSVLRHHKIDLALIAKIEGGENFTVDQLCTLGFDKWQAMKIVNFMNTGQMIIMYYERE